MPRKNSVRSTRDDVARLANVSSAVVSYVLNGGPRRVSPQATKKVLEAAAKLKYYPNSSARALRTGSTKTIGIIVPGLSNPYYSSMYDAIESGLSTYGYSVLYMSSKCDPDIERANIDKLVRRDVDAIVAATSENLENSLSTYQDREIRYILTDQINPVSWAKCISTDFYDAAEQAVKHFFSRNITKLAMISGRENVLATKELDRGWCSAHKNLGFHPGPILHSDFSRESGYVTTLNLLRTEYKPNGFFVASDMEALGVLRALHESGLKVPDDIAIISFDGTIDSMYTWPKLTVLAQDIKLIGDCVVKAIVDPDNTPNLKILKASLILRDSCL